eukprot:TRINITY_DN10975_c0_g1_i1.p1 TRINITY_DN10975_c0_g1~~TRINITY_DN10975_c0_g1_i1.p1  ORF type:complete len:326 (+),score=72.77 TRINITY_DN10975_c0_g1_i1:52-1029(+)
MHQSKDIQSACVHSAWDDDRIGAVHHYAPGKKTQIPHTVGQLESGFARFHDDGTANQQSGRRHVLPHVQKPYIEDRFSTKRHVPCVVTEASTSGDWNSTRRHIQPIIRPDTRDSSLRLFHDQSRPKQNDAQSPQFFHPERRHVKMDHVEYTGDKRETSLQEITGARKKVTDARNGFDVFSLGDKPYPTPECSADYFSKSHVFATIWRLPNNPIVQSRPGSTNGSHEKPTRFITPSNRRIMEAEKNDEVLDVIALDTWKPVPPPKPQEPIFQYQQSASPTATNGNGEADSFSTTAHATANTNVSLSQQTGGGRRKSSAAAMKKTKR